MIIITYSKTSADTIEQDIGKPEYSYYFIWKKYLPAMEKIATVIPVREPLQEVDTLYKKYKRKKEKCVFLSFTPPDETPTTLRCPTVCVFAWEFSTIPNETWGGKASSNWVASLKDAGHALTLSTYAEEVVKECISPRFPIATVPAPICSISDKSRHTFTANLDPFELEVAGKVIDSEKFEISFDRVTPIRDEENEGGGVVDWNSRPIQHEFCKENLEATQLLVGFYPAEDWGAWSRTVAPSIILPAAVSGNIELTIEMLAHGENVNREIEVILGSQSRTITVPGDLQVFTLEFELEEAADSIEFSGLTITQTTDARDHRTLGLGIKRIGIKRPGDESSASEQLAEDIPNTPPPLSKVKGAGVVYTSVLNPADGRKNWEDMVLAFCWTFKDTPDATLILKMTHNDISTFLGVLLQRFTQLPAFKCRVIAIQGYLMDEQYNKLIDATNYVVNTSYCEGQCLPLMEYMARGIPAIAPDHTAMRDYITTDNAFIIESNTKPTFWPHDERQYYRALMYEVNWGSITRAFEESYRVLKEDAARYESMGKNSQDSMRGEFSVEAIAPRLEIFLQRASKRRLFSFLK